MTIVLKKQFWLSIFCFALSTPAFAGWLDFWGGLRVVEGSGNIQKQTRNVGEFKGVHLGLSANVEMRQGERESVELEADDNLLPLIEVAVERGILQIRPAKRLTYPQPKNVRVIVYFRDISVLRVGGAGKVSIPAMKTGDLQVRIGGSGEIHIADLQVSHLDIDIGGSGQLSAAGQTEQIKADIGGSGALLMDKLEAANVAIRIGGSGNVRTWAKDSLDIKIGGSGEVLYVGDPKITKTIGGSGRVARLALNS